MEAEYQKETMHIERLKLGTSKTGAPAKPTLDGHGGKTYLGPRPTLYIRITPGPQEDFRKGWGPGYKHVGQLIPGIKVPEYDIRREALNWRELVHEEPAINSASRCSEIIKRANLLGYVHGPINCDANMWMKCKREAKEKKNYSKLRTLEFKTPKIEYVHLAFLYK